MFWKCLKYDLKNVLSSWWIAAVIVVLLAPVTSFFVNTLEAKSDVHNRFPFEALGLLFIFIAIIVFILFSRIICFIRYYKNCFTDEGYLTFTLPVKRSTVFNAKLAAAYIVSVLSSLVFLVYFFIVLTFIKDGDVPCIVTFSELICDLIDIIWKNMDAWTLTYIIEGIVLLIISPLIPLLMIFLCITLGGALVKKHKLLASLALIYGMNMVTSFAAFPFYFSTIFIGVSITELVTADTVKLFSALLLLLIILMLSTVIAFIYSVCTGTIERKLNLS